jgi:hypothetical protein
MKSKLTKYSTDGFYFHECNTKTLMEPQVGDARITFAAAFPDTMSIMAKDTRKNAGTISTCILPNEEEAYSLSSKGWLLRMRTSGC